MEAQDDLSPTDARKPLHIFCLAALIAFLFSAWQDFLVAQAREFLSGMHVSGGGKMMGYLIWQSATVLITSAVQLGGIALAIELIDQLRWSKLSSPERVRARSRYITVRLFRMANAKL